MLILLSLLNLVLHKGYEPNAFGPGLIVPIAKDNNNNTYELV